MWQERSGEPYLLHVIDPVHVMENNVMYNLESRLNDGQLASSPDDLPPLMATTSPLKLTAGLVLDSWIGDPSNSNQHRFHDHWLHCTSLLTLHY